MFMKFFASMEFVEKADDFVLSEVYGAAAHYFYKASVSRGAAAFVWIGCSKRLSKRY